MNTIKTKNLDFTFEIGVETEIFKTYALHQNVLYEVIGYKKLRKINKRKSKSIFKHTWAEIKKAIKNEDYFLPIPNEDNDENYGIYFENDHLQLLDDGVYSETLLIKEEY